MKKFFALLLALTMVLSLAVPALAAEPGKYDITIKQEFSHVHTYEAYQVFKGELHDDVLANIEWGDGVNGTAIIAKLKENAVTKVIFETANTAQEVADLLSDHSTNTELIHTFRHIVAENLTTNKHTSTYDAGTGIYTIANVNPGYYFIKDKDDSLAGTSETYTNYILEVVGATNITPKGGKVTHDKKILGEDDTEAADYSIGDVVTFELSGHLPENYEVFSEYSYRFVDTLSAGLTFNNDVKVYLENAGVEVELTTGFAVNVGAAATVPGATFTVDFPNLKAITDRTIDDHTKIIVRYTATINKDAEIGAPGNPNESYIIFDNDPHSDEEGKTPKDYVFVFTWELDITKIDGDKNINLANAEFVFYRMLEGTPHYVILDAENKVAGWTTNKDDATKLISDHNGDIVIIGLEADRYYLEETKAPDGYHLLEDPIQIDIRAEVEESADGTTGVVVKLEIKVDTNPIAEGDKENGTVAMEVVNNPGATLPETGGVGTTLFYLFGGLMVSAALVLLITKKRMSVEA